jgi:long-subunit fatty acid transport protein
MMWLLWISSAWASTNAGMGISPIGGGFAGVSEAGVMGVALNPAAAKSDQIEGAIDAGLSIFSLDVTLDGADTVNTKGMSPLPYAAFTMPIKDLGIGAYFMVPYGGGATFPAGGAQRFHVIDTESYLMEGGLSVAYQPLDWVRGGAAIRFGRATLTKRAAMNTASLINSKADLSPPLDTSDTLFMGEQDVALSGYGLGYALGLSFFLPEGHEVHLAYRSPMRVPMEGRVSLSPSDALGLVIDGDASGAMQFAREFELGVVVPAGKTRLSLMGGWVDWSPLAIIEVGLDGLQVSGEDSTADALIVQSGINDSGLTDTKLTILNDLGHGATFHGGGTVDVPIGKEWVVRTGAFFSPTTLPSEAMHASIVDFSVLDLRLAAAYTPKDWLTIGLSVDHYLTLDRDINNSSLALDNTAESGRVLPSANGLYTMDAARVGLTFIARH